MINYNELSQKVLDYIRKHTYRRGPTLLDISSNLDISLTVAKKTIRKLKNEGVVDDNHAEIK